jgi:hypothetical protein
MHGPLNVKLKKKKNLVPNFSHFIIPLLGVIFRIWILYTLEVKERPVPNSSFYAFAGHYLIMCRKQAETCRSV